MISYQYTVSFCVIDPVKKHQYIDHSYDVLGIICLTSCVFKWRQIRSELFVVLIFCSKHDQNDSEYHSHRTSSILCTLVLRKSQREMVQIPLCTAQSDLHIRSCLPFMRSTIRQSTMQHFVFENLLLRINQKINNNTLSKVLVIYKRNQWSIPLIMQ